jgi:DNA-binding MarR family transcriptional regulator
MDEIPIPALPCLCSSFRRTARALTQHYEEAVRSLGVTTSQFTILLVLSKVAEVSQGQLGHMLAMDSTTLTRTLGIMKRNGWIAERRGDDRRVRCLRLSKAGETKLESLLPAWEKVQSRLRRKLGDHAWSTLMHLSNQITELLAKEGD